MSAAHLNGGGGCLCAQFRYEISGTPLAMFKCHCRDCQERSGGPYSLVIFLSKTAYRATQGCDESIGILAASLDDPTAFVEQFNINVADEQPWDHIRDDVPSFAGLPI